MWCEYVNKLIAFNHYTINDYDECCFYNNETNPLGIICWTIFTILVLIFLSWWMIPVRLLLSNPKFKCKRR